MSNIAISTSEQQLKTEDEKSVKIPEFNLVVDPPSPGAGSYKLKHLEDEAHALQPCDDELHSFYAKSEKFSTSDATTSNCSSKTYLLGFDLEQPTSWSPAATRRISCCSMLNPNEAAAVAAAAATATSKFYSDTEKKGRKDDKEKEGENRKLPIINPLVRLPAWPSELIDFLFGY